MWNPPALTATGEGQDLDSVTTMIGGADDPGHIKFYQFGSVSFPDVHQNDVQGDCFSYLSEFKTENKRLCLDLNRLTDPKTDANFIDIKFLDDKSDFNEVSQTSYPEVMMSELNDLIDESNTVPADCSVNYKKLEADINFMPQSCELVSGYPIKAHGREDRNSIICRLPMSSSPSPSFECGTSSVLPYPNCSQQIVNGNFLSLGIGGGMDTKSNSKFSTREIASKLADPLPSHYMVPIVGQTPTNPSSLTPLVGWQSNVGALSSSSLADTRVEGVHYGDTRSKINPIQFPGFQAPQANPRSNFPTTYDNFGFNLNSSLSPSVIPINPQCGFVNQNLLGTQMPRPTSFSRQGIRLQQHYNSRSSINAPSESAWYKGSPVGHEQLGRLMPLAEAKRPRNIGSVCFPRSVQPVPVGNLSLQEEGATSTGFANTSPSPSNIQPVGQTPYCHNVSSIAGSSLISDRFAYPIPRVSPIQSAATFPRRLGVQPAEPTPQTIGAIPETRLPVHAYPVRPIVPSGQHQHAVPAQVPTVSSRPDYSSSQAAQLAKYGVGPHGIVSRPRLKRQQTVNPSNERLLQRRKISPRPAVIHQPTTSKTPSFPSTRAPIRATRQIPPEAPLHIKWEGSDEPIEPSGHKCFLCKRDISFTTEGRMYQPPIPPAAAVLPCGHTFHDDCLQKITPKDCLKDPPCIPCALGET
ncbi:RING/U-box superfamily protein [Striga asiatica]|uniref:RING/U-box superfamily protein n=1 Tax=Striga asiatica TaxID=4170 RepID=A0A5A7QUD8_STRAF|nr:RING/U-box superfamily protein [Striga asiatica]